MSAARRRETWEDMHRCMLAETSRFIEWGLAHPEDIIEIPAKPVGQGGFPKSLGTLFWMTVLSSRQSRRLDRLREFFRRGWRG